MRSQILVQGATESNSGVMENISPPPPHLQSDLVLQARFYKELQNHNITCALALRILAPLRRGCARYATAKQINVHDVQFRKPRHKPARPTAAFRLNE
ncbi:hypothetical protein TNCV_1840971 [Trichonephila clavipes]|nr:hypothetical protein TNCV_1840971 [Trichonephila clavipes]